MKERINIQNIEPESFQAMFGLEKYLNSTKLDPKLKNLIKIRSSQINGCAYCIEMHTTEARKLGESEQRIYALSAWRESPLFSEEERVVLAMTEEITLIANKGLTEETYEETKKKFEDNEVAQIIMHIITINAWNRIAISTNMFHK